MVMTGSLSAIGYGLASVSVWQVTLFVAERVAGLLMG